MRGKSALGVTLAVGALILVCAGGASAQKAQKGWPVPTCPAGQKLKFDAAGASDRCEVVVDNAVTQAEPACPAGQVARTRPGADDCQPAPTCDVGFVLHADASGNVDGCFATTVKPACGPGGAPGAQTTVSLWPDYCVNDPHAPPSVGNPHGGGLPAGCVVENKTADECVYKTSTSVGVQTTMQPPVCAAGATLVVVAGADECRGKAGKLHCAGMGKPQVQPGHDACIVQ